MCLSTDR